MRKGGKGGKRGGADREEHLPVLPIGHCSQDQHEGKPVEGPELPLEKGSAGVKFLRRGLVVRRGATDDRRDIEVVEVQSVVLCDRGWLVAESGLVKGPVEEVPGAVAGKDTAGPVSSVGCRGEAQDPEAGGGIPKSRNRPAPVALVRMAGDPFPGDRLPPCDKTGTAATVDDFRGKGEKVVAPHAGPFPNGLRS